MLGSNTVTFGPRLGSPAAVADGAWATARPVSASTTATVRRTVSMRYDDIGDRPSADVGEPPSSRSTTTNRTLPPRPARDQGQPSVLRSCTQQRSGSGRRDAV